jgi:hypothetical protein
MRTHEERTLVAGLSSLNADLSRYVLKVIEADHTGTHWPHTAKDEAAIALRMVQLAGQLEIHVKLLQGSESEQEPTVIEGVCASRLRDPGGAP